MGAGETVMDYRHIWAVISRSHIPPVFSRRQKSCIMVSQRRPGTRAALSVCMNASCHFCIYQLEQTKRETTVLNHQTNYQPEKKKFFQTFANFWEKHWHLKVKVFFFFFLKFIWTSEMYFVPSKNGAFVEEDAHVSKCAVGFVFRFNCEASENVQTVKNISSINGMRQFSSIKLLLNLVLSGKMVKSFRNAM